MNIKALLGGASRLGLVALSWAWVSGCATGPERAPSALDERLFQIDTNLVPVIEVSTNVTAVTNVVAEDTPEGGGERVAVAVTWTTNYVVRTNYVPSYEYRPGAGAQAMIESGRGIGELFGFGGLAGTVAGGLFGAWAALRSSRTRKTAAVLAQVIQTGREVLQTTPQGRELGERWKAWMIKHQAEAGVIEEVQRLLASAVDGESARQAAARLTSWLGTPAARAN